jgi:hypothetical protein
MKKILIVIMLAFCSTGFSQQTLYSRSTANTWSTTLGGPNCACFPTPIDTVEISHNWAATGFYPLTHPANLAFGNYFPVASTNNPFKVVIRSGGVAYQTGSIPTGMILQVDAGGMWGFNGGVTFNTSAANSIALINNEGAILVNGSFVNNLAISSPGEFCTTGSFTQNLGGTFNGITDADLAPKFTHTNYGGFANCLQMIVLPVELLSFKADKQLDYIQYKWQTASELNNDFFEILVSNDTYQWKSIHTILGAGNSNEVLSYEEISANTNFIYAKLKQVDYDGTEKFSDIIHLENLDFKLIADNNNITIDVKSVTSYEIFDTSGNVIIAGRLETGTNNIKINETGIFIIRIGVELRKIITY